MKISLISTVFDESITIESFLESILIQTKIPQELVIVDACSSDDTARNINNFKQKFNKKNIDFKLLSKKGNRAVGRNEAIKNANNEIIVCSDAGCILDKDWILNIIKPFNDPKVDVVAGYYRGVEKTIFQKCLIPYVLVMPDRIKEKEFLPATRSIAFRKSIWRKAGGFNEKYSHNEDYVFARKLKQIGACIVFEKKAIANWSPSKNLRDAFVMFYRFAKGDSEAHVFRLKVVFIFLRYVTGLSLAAFYIILKSNRILSTLFLLLFFYILWAIIKNYKYVKNYNAVFYLPLIQFASDFAVILGTTVGFIRKQE